MAKQVKTKHTKSKGYIITVIGFILLISVSLVAGYSFNNWQRNFANTPIEQRKSRILDIYKSLNLDSKKYQPESSNIFGDKRVYEWDNSRTYASSQTFERGANVDATVAELRKSIETAGFTYFEEPYPGSTYTQLHFKSAKGEYLRLTVSSKPRDDAIRNSVLMNPSSELSKNVIEMDPNQGPSNVTIKVNLDDNNE